MTVQKKSEPRCISVNVQTQGGGKVAIKDFGKISSGWGMSFSRSFEIPEDWSPEAIDEFQLAQQKHLADLIEPLDQAEFDVRYEQRDWND